MFSNCHRIAGCFGGEDLEEEEEEEEEDGVDDRE
jgi:hypothetical protein